VTPSDRSGRDASHLRAVPTDEAHASEAGPLAAPGGADPQGAGATPSRRVTLLLAVALLAAIAGLAVESRRAARLGDQVTVLEGELRSARSALEAHRQRLAEARLHVSDLRGRVETLDALLASEPGAPAGTAGPATQPPGPQGLAPAPPAVPAPPPAR